MTSTDTLGDRTIRTNVPARLDRLPWSRFHWRIVIGLGTVWILDGLEVTIVGSIAPRLTESGSGINLDAADIGTAAAIYVAGACLGALFFGQLTDRYGRKKLFMLTLGLYLLATVATAFATEAWMFFLFRFFTGAGIGGEYAAINSAIDELIPARNRGQVDLAINGSYWVGAAIGGFASLFLLDTSVFQSDLGWRLAFASGAVIGLGILFVRRHVPESPRWLFIHGREDEAERIVDRIERETEEEVGRELPEPKQYITIRQRDAIPFREIARVAFRKYPRRAILGLSLFIGQAFLYNAVTFDLGTILHGFFDVSSSDVPLFMIVFAVSNFLGPLLLGRYFDTIGRIPMIAGTYLVSATIVAALGVLLITNSLDRVDLHGAGPVDLLLRVSRRELGLPDRERNLPDGDACPCNRVLLRPRDRPRWDHRPGAVRSVHPQRRSGSRGARLPDRSGCDGAWRRRRAVLRRARGAAVARGDRHAAHRRGSSGRGAWQQH